MTNEDLNQMICETFKKILDLRRVKGGEYSEDNDALSNFRRNAEDLEMEMEAVWRVYAGKHWDALSQYVRDVQSNFKRELSEPIESRIDDLILYLCLFKAMVRERRKDDDRRLVEIDVQKASS